jgi:iron complex transport system substrate-binding protein
VPEMIRLAGGIDVLGHEGAASYQTTWETVLALEPELVILGPCGFDLQQAVARAGELRLPCPVVAVDGDAYYSRPAPRLADGVRQLANLLHPAAAPDPGLPFAELSSTRATPA